MEKDKITPAAAAAAQEPAPGYVAIPLEYRSAHLINLENNNAPPADNDNSTANRTWYVRIFAVRPNTFDEAERQIRAASLIFALLGVLGISIMVGTLIALYLETK